MSQDAIDDGPKIAHRPRRVSYARLATNTGLASLRTL